MSKRPLLPRRLTTYVLSGFIQYFFLCLAGLSSIYLLVEFFERLDNLIAQGLSIVVMLHYISLRFPQVVFQILPVAVLMATLLTMGGMARQGELIASLAGGISLYQIIIPLIILFFLFSLTSGLYFEFCSPLLTQKAVKVLAQIKGEKPPNKLYQGKIWLSGKQGRFFSIQFLDLKDRSLHGVTIFEVGEDFRLKRRWDILKCIYKEGLWYLDDVKIWSFTDGRSKREAKSPKVVGWPEAFSDFASLSKSPQEMGYRELKSYIRRLDQWGYNTAALRTDLYFKWAFPLTCLIFGLCGIPFAIRLQRGVKYFSLGISILVAFSYWIIAHLAVSMGHWGILPPIIGAWSGNIVFGLLGLVLIVRIRS